VEQQRQVKKIVVQRRAFADPIRVRVREVLAAHPRTAKQLAEDVGMEANRLYYHLRLLEQAGLIEVIGREASGRLAEKVYAATDASFGNELPGDDPADTVSFFHSLLDATKADLTEVVVSRAEQRLRGDVEMQARVLKGVLFAGDADIAAFVERVEAAIAELDEAARSQLESHGEKTMKTFPFTFVIYEQPARRGRPDSETPATALGRRR
jgi:DNA-binding transcriptional ArsR family regulator